MDIDRTPDHLNVTTTDRGFSHLPVIPGTYGGSVRVYESSADSGPHVWLNATCPVDLNHPTGPSVEATLHMAAEDAWRLAEQIMHLVKNHYQGDASPDGMTEPKYYDEHLGFIFDSLRRAGLDPTPVEENGETVTWVVTAGFGRPKRQRYRVTVQRDTGEQAR